jgi:hypothetical protein
MIGYLDWLMQETSGLSTFSQPVLETPIQKLTALVYLKVTLTPGMLFPLTDAL